MTDEEERVEGVGWIDQVMMDDGEWVSWTQWKQREAAEHHAIRLLENERHGFHAARIVRVDWTVVQVIDRGPVAKNPGLGEKDE